MARILITGGGGYIGSILTPALLAAGHDVTVPDPFIYGESSLQDSCADALFYFARGGSWGEVMLRGLNPRADVIIPLAALVGAPLGERDQTGARTTCPEAILVRLKHRTQPQAIPYSDTSSGYDACGTGEPCMEASPHKAITFNGCIKVEADKALLDAGNTISFRPPPFPEPSCACGRTFR